MTEGGPTRTHWDAIVVGAGPGGSTAARALAQEGLGVLVIEKSEHPRPKACGGGLTGNVRQYLDFDVSEVVESFVTRTAFLFKGEHPMVLDPPSLAVEMVQRPRFDALLAEKAVEAGATLLARAPIKGLRRSSGGGPIEVETPRGTFTAPLVVGADGANTATGRLAGLRVDPVLGVALDADLEPAPGAEDLSTTAVFDFGVVPNGYAWSFPKRGVHSIGVGTTHAKFPEIHEHLASFRMRHPALSGGRILHQRGAPLPFWTGHQPLDGDGVTLVGDAAGLVDPLSGEGISYAVRSGRMLAPFARDFVRGDRRALAGYDELVRREIASEFAYALRLANFFFAHPSFSYRFGIRNPWMSELFARMIAGQVRYHEIHDYARNTVPGRIFRMVRGVANALRPAA